MPKRTFLVAAILILALGGVTIWLVAGDRSPGGPAAPGAAGTASPAADQPTPKVEQADLDRLAQAEDMRGLWFTLRSSYEGGVPLERSRQRMEAALRRLWPGPSPSWKAACRNRVCRILVEAAGPADAWRAALKGDPSVSDVADRIGWDPDGNDPAAYVLLSQEGAEPGSSILDQVERRLREAPAVQECLRQSQQAGALEYDLAVDDSGITYRRGGNLEVSVQACVDEQLSAIVTSTEIPPSVKGHSLKIVLRSPR